MSKLTDSETSRQVACLQTALASETDFYGPVAWRLRTFLARKNDAFSIMSGPPHMNSIASMLRGIIGSPAPFEGVRRKFESFRSNNLYLNAWFHQTVLMRRWEFSGKLWIKVYKLFEFCIISNTSSWRVNICLLVLWQLAVDDEDVGASIKRSLSSERLSILRCRNALTVD